MQFSPHPLWEQSELEKTRGPYDEGSKKGVEKHRAKNIEAQRMVKKYTVDDQLDTDEVDSDTSLVFGTRGLRWVEEAWGAEVEERIVAGKQ